ncbi:glycoside hydrolase [Mucilaginibacter mali]|uniref:Glycoside hydrolase n=1 Tax=Mucilaginibacter mali TaxID=2740462 RepID=A0A7D4QU22_9SPHI|nr:glycoside hydrolase [Mucilaginibacter mali]QKJ30929.1 glycoside hydrolase [Mucilaginibacter mali]
MKKRLFSTIALVCGAFLICLAIAADLTGKWTGSIKTPNGDFPVKYTFKVDGEALTGTADSDQGSIPITDGKISGNNFVFNLNFNGTPLKNVGKFYGDSITIDVNFQGTNLHGMLKRVEEKK